MGLKCDLLIYIKRMNDGVWVDEQELVPVSDLESHIDSLRSEDATISYAVGQAPDFWFEEEIIRYHAKYTPQKSANIEYHRPDA